ncbi:MAG: hypothetical protein ACTSU5_10045 [Promethearchaeota archaeon]
MEKIDRKHMLTRVLGGMVAGVTLLYFFYLLPWLFVQFFKIGLKGSSLAIICLSLPVAVVSLSILRMSAKRQVIIGNASSWVAGLSAGVLGLVVEFGIDENSNAVMVLVDFFIVAGFVASFLQVRNLGRSAPRGDDGGKPGVEAFVGLSLAVLLPGILLFVTGHETWTFYWAAFLFLLKPLVQSRSALSVRVGAGVGKASRGRPWHNRLQTMLATLLVLMNFFVLYYSAIEYDSPGKGWGFVGIATGVLAQAGLNRRLKRDLLSWIPSLSGVAVVYTLFWIQWAFFTTPGGMVLCGFFAGASMAIFYTATIDNWVAGHPLDQAVKYLLLIVLVVGISLGVHEVKFLVRDQVEYLWILPTVGLSSTVVTGVLVKALKLEFFGNKLALAGRELARLNWSKKVKVAALAVSVAGLVFTPALVIGLRLNSRASVHVQLDRPMYTLDGRLVTSIDLREKTAQILLYEKNPAGIAHGENIRPRKTVRLGAYLYGGYEHLTDEEAKAFIANNFDVFSLGGYTENLFFPDDIADMRSTNPGLRFYIMTFATTLGEDDSWSIDGPYAPFTKWNATMDLWTVKDNDGVEAIGVRHTSTDCKGHLMDLGNTEWADYYAWLWDHRVKAYHADGVAIDEVMWRGYWGTRVEDLRDYDSVAEITQTCYSWLERVDQGMTSEVITQAFWDEAQQYQQGIWGELAFRSGGAYGNRVDDREAVVFYEQMNWQEIVENMVSHSNRSRSYIWAAWYRRGDSEALEYCVATYLMGKVNGETSVVFHPQPVYDGGYPYNLAGYSVETVKEEVEANPTYFDLELGDALGPMTLISGTGGQVWERNFTNGVVFVNPFHAFVPGFDSGSAINPSH